MVLERNISVPDYCFAVFHNSVFRMQCRDSYYFYSYTHQYALYKLCIFLHKHYNLQYRYFIDVLASDFPQNAHRFQLTYNLFSILNNTRMLLSFVVHNKAALFSITSLFSAANWYEREIWDLFGLAFLGNKDMRRILTDYGFTGHPMKKDYPLSGYVEVKYEENLKCIRYQPVRLIQEYRN